jgi:soluble calcium-activated nucleotidase 1
MGAGASSLPYPEGVSESARKEIEALPAASELPESVSEATRKELEALPDGAKSALKCAAELAASKIVDEAQGYRDDGAFEHGHAPLKAKIEADKAKWADMVAKATPPSDGAEFKLAMIADQDDASKVDSGEHGETQYWLSKLAFSTLKFSGGAYTLAMGDEATLKTTRGDKSGRGAEYSALELFDGKLLTMDDRTGNVDEIVAAPEGSAEKYAMQPLVNSEGKSVALYLGDGTAAKGLKCEWSTIKDGKLVIGSTGKPRTDDDAVVIHHGEMWTKTIDPSTYTVSNVEGVAAYNSLCAAAQVPGAPNIGEKSKGFMVHESGRWSDVHKHWFFAPRKLSRDTYDTVSEAYKCVNLMIAAPGELPAGGPAPEKETAFGATCAIQPYLGMLPMRGCSDFMFVPGTNDCHVFMMRTEESHDGVINTFASVMDLQGKLLMVEQKLTADRKFEGCSWLGDWKPPAASATAVVADAQDSETPAA